MNEHDISPELDAFHTATEECIYWLSLQFDDPRETREALFCTALVIRDLPEFKRTLTSFEDLVRASGGSVI